MSPIRVLLCSDKVFDSSGDAKLQSYLYSKRSVLPVIYSWDETRSFVDLFEQIYSTVRAHASRSSGPEVVSIGVMFHSQERYTLQMFANDTRRSTVHAGDEDSSFADFRDFVRLCRIAFGIDELDIISCWVVDNTRNTILNTMGAALDVKINASVKQEGAGGNWTLEEGNVDMVGRYFKKNIKKTD